MWLTILDYRTGDVICKEINEELEIDTDVNDYAKTITGHNDTQCMWTTMLTLQVDEIKNESITHITKN